MTLSMIRPGPLRPEGRARKGCPCRWSAVEKAVGPIPSKAASKKRPAQLRRRQAGV